MKVLIAIFILCAAPAIGDQARPSDAWNACMAACTGARCESVCANLSYTGCSSGDDLVAGKKRNMSSCIGIEAAAWNILMQEQADQKTNGRTSGADRLGSATPRQQVDRKVDCAYQVFRSNDGITTRLVARECMAELTAGRALDFRDLPRIGF